MARKIKNPAKPKTYLGISNSKQSTWEKDLKEAWKSGKKLKGQQTLTSAVSTSKRLIDWGI